MGHLAWTCAINDRFAADRPEVIGPAAEPESNGTREGVSQSLEGPAGGQRRSVWGVAGPGNGRDRDPVWPPCRAAAERSSLRPPREVCEPMSIAGIVPTIAT